MKRLSLCFVFVASIVSHSVYALDEPVGSKYDSRLKQVPYNEDDVVKIDSVIGVSTHLILDPSEKYITYAFGDPDAWEFAHKLNHYFVKPKDAMSDTNLTIVTDKRTYNFDIRYHEKDYQTEGKSTFDKSFTFQIKFRYPEIEAALAKEKAEKERLEKRKNEVRSYGFNIDYSMNGSREIAPVNVWDDGVFTFIKFGPGQEVPAIFFVDADGQESIVGQHSIGVNKEIIVMHRVSHEWYLRLGKKVTGVYNNSLIRREAGTNTSSPLVVREVK